MKYSHRRESYSLVNKSHQYRFLALVLIYNALIVLFLAGTLFLPDVIHMQDETLGLDVRATYAERILSTHVKIWPALIALICVMGLHSFRVFHRFVGPLYRFCRAFEEIRDGNLNFRIRLRKKDYLHAEEETLNHMLEALSTRLRNSQDAAEDAMVSWNEIHPLVQNPAEKERIAAHGEHIKRIVEALGHFRTKRDREEGFPPSVGDSAGR